MAQNKPYKKTGPKHTTPKKEKPINLLGIATRQPVKTTPWGKGRDPQQGFAKIGRNDQDMGNHSSGKTRLKKVGVRKKLLKKVEKR